ncbi:SDR family oxidoreductase [Tardiphaga alba]|uniref:SDR family oxidoreductase n=1 Tax=Tardiphaga alba TaxID=340268 RepID=A0ABX8AAI9_9BRAD|nr:SDR family oxidoreductase [Tardiphaga alba]QUS40778.1 SDR family oxidoreductase [Tardiphaga alba]
MTVENKVAIIIGASGGIGRAIALRLAMQGFAIVAHYAGNPAKADEIVAAIKARGGQAISAKADVAAEAEVRAVFKAALDTFGRIDVVVQSSGIMPLTKIEEGDLATFDRVIATNLRGTYIVFGEAARHVAEGGRIIAFSSSVLAKSFPSFGPYIASKAGVDGLVRVLANELRGRNITVNAVAPGPTGTDLFFKGRSGEEVEEFAKLAPLERIGTPEDAADIVAFLASPSGGWVNAQIIRSNGGFA